MKFGTELLYNKLSKKGKFRENRLSDSHTVLKGTMNCYRYCTEGHDELLQVLY